MMPSSARPCRLICVASCSGQPIRAAARLNAEGCGRHSISGRQKSLGELLADAVIEGIAAGEHHDGLAAPRRNQLERLMQRARPRQPLAADQRFAPDQDGARRRPRARRRRSGAAPIGDSPSMPSSPMPTMDSQRVALQVAAEAHHGPRLACAFSFSAAPPKPRTWRDCWPATTGSSRLVAGRPHRLAEAAAAADAHRRFRRHCRVSKPGCARTASRRDRRHPSLCRADLGARGRRLQRLCRFRSRSILRAPWQRDDGDKWIEVETPRPPRRALGSAADARVSQPRPARACRLRGRAAASLHRAHHRSARRCRAAAGYPLRP